MASVSSNSHGGRLPGQLSFDDELARLLSQCNPRNRLRSSAPPGDGPARLLRRLVTLGLPEHALPAAAGLILALDSAIREQHALGNGHAVG